MKTIGSFKLHKRGDNGISISSEQLSKSIISESDGTVYHDEVNTFRKDSVPRHILDAINRLKFFYLNLTGHWIDLYDQYLDTETYLLEPVTENAKAGRRHLQTLWESTWVTQAKIDHNSFTLIGMLEIVDNKMCNISPPKVTSDDEIEFYENTRETIQGIIGLLVQYFSTAAISDVADYRKYLLAHADETGKGEIANFDETQIVNKVMDEFSKQGAIIMMDGGPVYTQDAIEETSSTDTVEEIKEPEADFEPEPESEQQQEGASTDPKETMEAGENWDAGEEGEGEEQVPTPAPEKAKEPFGKPEAEDGQAEQVSESMEFSENVGDGDISEEGTLDDVPNEDFE